MKRVYVIMRAPNECEFDTQEAEPVDVVSTMTRADALCYELENEDEGEHYYYWHEVISSED